MNERQSDIGMYLVEVRKTKLLTKEEEYELALKIQDGDVRAEEELVKSNLRFVVSVARQYQNVGIELKDLINEGNIGLIRAARRFKPELGNKFISYAVWYVKQAILQCINDNSRMIRLPVNISNEISRQKKYFTMEMPTDEILYPRVSSLDAGFNTDTDTFTDILSDDTFDQPDIQMIKKEMSLGDALEGAMSTLDERERYIIDGYFLSSDKGKTLEIIGEELGLTKERVRQVRDKALRKIRNNSEALFDFLT